QVAVTPDDVLAFRRRNVVAPDDVIVDRPVGDVAVENAFGRQHADGVGETNQIQLALLQLQRVENDAGQIEEAEQMDADAVVQVVLQPRRAVVKKRDAAAAIEQQIRQRVHDVQQR